MAAFQSFVLLCVVGTVFSEKDSRYYPPGRSNPNVNDPYYWKNSLNVMQDLDQFESLYVEYSGCVWSRYGFGDGCDDVGAANQDDDEQSNTAYWYLGRTMCFRANAAYSLYGVLQGDEDLGCHKKQYIKSFFSVWGPESFAGPLGLDTERVSSYCQTWDQRYLRLLAEDDRYNFQDDDEWKNSNEFPAYANDKMTYTTGCSADGKFVTESFKGGACDATSVVETVDFLEDFNNEIESLGCTKIYSASGDLKYGGDDGGEEGKAPVNIIMNSQACLLDQYPTECPDPHGKLKAYTRKLNAATAGTQPFDRNVAAAKGAASWIMFSIGVAMLALAMFVRTKKKVPSIKPEMYSDAVNIELDNPLLRAASSISIKITETATKAFVAATEIEPDHCQDSAYYDAEYTPPKETELVPATPTRHRDSLTPVTTSPLSTKKPASVPATPPHSPSRFSPVVATPLPVTVTSPPAAKPFPVAPVKHPEVIKTGETTTSRISATVTSNNTNTAAPAPKPPTKKKSWYSKSRKSKG